MGPIEPQAPSINVATRPRWSEVLRALREARGITLDGWGARLGVSRTTVQRWERGERAPDPGAEASILAYCREAGLLRAYDRGPLAGLNLTPEMLQNLLAEARWRVSGRPADAGSPVTVTPPAVSDAPPPAMPSPPSNLPLQLTSFVGREQEIAAVRRVQASTRLLTLTGPGGCGKSRLALRVADELLWAYPHGVWFVDLASLADPALVAQAVASALALGDTGPAAVVETLIETLRSRHLLLLLDNCEHLQPECAALVETLLRACPNLAVLATSRASLGIPGETVWRVPPMTIPGLGFQPANVITAGETLEHWTPGPDLPDAFRLFVERARLLRPECVPTPDEVIAAAEICRQLDGMPLAIELAAARITVLSVTQIADRLSDRFRLLTGGGRAALPRHQTLRATIDWSYDLLSEPERVLLRTLSVFAGSFTLEAAEAVYGAGDILDLLARLVDHSLVVADDHGAVVRYRLLETVRQYAAEKLEIAGDLSTSRDRHLAWYTSFAQAAGRAFQGPDEPAWLNRLEQEHDNLRAALAWSLTRGDVDHGLRLAGALPRFWELRGHMSEGRQWLARVLAMEAPAPTVARAEALNGAAILAQMQGDYAAAQSHAQESLQMHQELGNLPGIADARWTLGYVALRRGDIETARELLETSLTLHTDLNCTRGIAGAHGALGVLFLRLGDYAAARRHFDASHDYHRRIGDKDGVAAVLVDLASAAGEANPDLSPVALLEESLALYREIGNRQGIALALSCLGTAAWFDRDLDKAATLLEESLALYREVGDRRGIARVLGHLALVALTFRNESRAASLCRESLTHFQAGHDTWSIARYLPVLAGALFRQGHAEQAARLYGAGAAMRKSLGASLPSNVQVGHDRAVAALRTALGDAAFTAAWSAGEALSPDEAVAEALEQPAACQP